MISFLVVVLVLCAIYSAIVLINLLNVTSEQKAVEILAKKYKVSKSYITHVIETSDFERERDV